MASNHALDRKANIVDSGGDVFRVAGQLRRYATKSSTAISAPEPCCESPVSPRPTTSGGRVLAFGTDRNCGC